MRRNRLNRAYTMERLSICGPMLGAFSRAIDYAAAIDCWVQVATQFGDLHVCGIDTLADLVDAYDALRDEQ